MLSSDFFANIKFDEDKTYILRKSRFVEHRIRFGGKFDQGPASMRESAGARPVTRARLTTGENTNRGVGKIMENQIV